jgi:hypothetical protein
METVINFLHVNKAPEMFTNLKLSIPVAHKMYSVINLYNYIYTINNRKYGTTNEQFLKFACLKMITPITNHSRSKRTIYHSYSYYDI